MHDEFPNNSDWFLPSPSPINISPTCNCFTYALQVNRLLLQSIYAFPITTSNMNKRKNKFRSNLATFSYFLLEILSQNQGQDEGGAKTGIYLVAYVLIPTKN